MLFTLQRYEFFSKSQPILVVTLVYARCCLPYKGTNFSANHNTSSVMRSDGIDVVYPTKVRIFQQITTLTLLFPLLPPMLFTLQRYEFFSKSQQSSSDRKAHRDVVYPTKVRIFQQITTWVTAFYTVTCNKQI